MFSVIVSTTKGTKVGEFQCIHSECQIGKDPSQLIVLRGLKISKNHATLRQDKNGIFIEDNKSITGLKVNDQRYKSYGPIVTTDKIQVGDYQLRVHTSDPQYDAQSAPHEAAGNSVHSGVPSPQEQSALDSIVPQAEKQQSSVIDHELIQKIKVRNEWRRKVHTELLKLMDLRRVNVNEMSDIELRTQSESLINQIIAGFSLPADIEVSSLVKEVLDETIGLGPLEALIADPDVSEIMVNSHDQIFYEKAGKLYLSDIAFSDDQAVLGAIERIVTPIGRRIDESSPMVDARLKDGSRVNAVIPPLALKGPCITIRKFMQRRLGCDDLVKFG
ncbi:ATPase, T2SS/T4P/T4SS family [Shewanella baltica]